MASAAALPTPVAPAAPAPQTTALNTLDPKELEKFLVDFVVEHTGYPPEIVELDADLEADLGIDSIKKARNSSANWVSISTSVHPRIYLWTVFPPCATCWTTW